MRGGCRLSAVSTTAALAPPRAVASRVAPGSPGAAPRRQAVRSRYGLIALGALALAAASLRFPSTPTYDPWSWIVWGREIVHLTLVTTGGPTWKPLPVIFTTVFAPFGSSAPQLWLLLARAGGIAALAVAFVLAFRLTRAISERRFPAALAGAIAALALLLLPQYVNYVALGESEGLLAAAALMMVNRHLDGSPRQALFWALVVALDRPEAWPLFVAYAIHVWRRDRGSRRRVGALSAMILPLWFVPELIGSGSLIRGVQTAQHPRPEAATFARCPFCTEITDHALHLVAWPLWLGAVGLLVFAVTRLRRRGADEWARAAVALIVVSAVWFLEEAILTQAGFSGNPRYLVGAAALVVVAAGVGWTLAATWLVARVTELRRPLALPLLAALPIVAAVVILVTPVSRRHLVRVSPTEASLRFQAELRDDLQRAVDRAGGVSALVACGPVQTNPSEVPLTAWTLNLGLADLVSARAAVIIQSRNAEAAPLLPVVHKRRRLRLAARVGATAIFTRCADQARR